MYCNLYFYFIFRVATIENSSVNAKRNTHILLLKINIDQKKEKAVYVAKRLFMTTYIYIFKLLQALVDSF